MFGGLYQGGLCSLKLDAHFNFFGFENGASGGYRFSPDTEGCAGCGQEPPPLIGAALLPSAGQVSVFEICEGALIWTVCLEIDCFFGEG